MSGNGFYPPDSNGAIGPSQVVRPVNLTMNVYTRTGALKKSTAFNTFFGTSLPLSDPRVQYDPVWRRWVVSVTVVPPAGFTGAGCFFVGASQTSSATGAFYTAEVCFGGGIFAAAISGITTCSA